MPPSVASIIYTVGILALYYLDRGHHTRVSKALWIAAVWLFIVCSRPVSMWLGMAPSSGSLDVYLEGSPVDRALYIALEIAAAATVVSRMNRVSRLLRENVAILLFFAFSAVSIVWSDFPLVAFKHWIKAIGDLAVVLIILTESDPLGAIKWLITRLGFLLFPLSVLFIKYYPRVGRLLTGSWENTFTGITTQKNSLGVICMLYGVGFLWLFRAAYLDRGNPGRRRRLLWAYGTTFLTIVWLLHKCKSTTSIAGFAMAGGVMLLASRTSSIRSRTMVHWLVFAVVSVSAFAVFFDSGGGIVTELGKDSTLSGRKYVWDLVLSVPNNQWVGTGFETFWLGDRLAKLRFNSGFNFPINEAHNGYIEVFLNLGWAGVTLMTVFLLTGYGKIIAAFRQDPESGCLLVGLFLATFFESLTEAAFRMHSPSWIFVILAVFAATAVVRSSALSGIRKEHVEVEDPAWVAESEGVAIHQQV